MSEYTDGMRKILSSLEGVEAMVVVDAAGKITSWSGAAEEIFGWKASEAVGNIARELLIPERYRESHHTRFNAFLQSGGASNRGYLFAPVHAPVLTKERGEIICQMVVAPIAQGGSFSFVAFFRDISSRNRIPFIDEVLLRGDRG